MNWKNIHSLSNDDRKQHEVDYGGFNDFPPNWRSVSDEEMARSMFFNYSPELVDYRQMWNERRRDRGDGYIPAKLFFMHDGSGFGLVADYHDGTVEWYRFDGPCVHEMEVVRSQMNFIENVCTKCGYGQAIDSSG